MNEGMSLVESEPDVLVVDDDQDLRELLTEWLQSMNYRVHAVSNGLRALDYLEVRTPRLVILDIMMPVMDGWGFLAERRKCARLSSIPVIIASANLDLMKEQEIVLYDKLAKPFDTGRLLTLVEKWVSRPQSR